MTERQEEQAALHALHLLDPHEERILQSDARNDAKLAALIPELAETAGQIALAMPPEAPPPEIRHKLLSELKQRRRAKVTSFAMPLRSLTRPWLAWAAVVVVSVAAWKFHKTARLLQEEATALKSDAALAREETTAIRQNLEATEKKLAESKLDAAEQTEKVTQLSSVNALARMEAASLRAVIKRYDEAMAVVVWDGEKQEGKLRFEKMPPVATNKDYQLWIIDKKSAVAVSAGVIKVDSRGTATMTFKPVEPVTQIAKFAISIETLGGVAKKSLEGPIILASP